MHSQTIAFKFNKVDLRQAAALTIMEKSWDKFWEDDQSFSINLVLVRIMSELI